MWVKQFCFAAAKFPLAWAAANLTGMRQKNYGEEANKTRAGGLRMEPETAKATFSHFEPSHLSHVCRVLSPAVWKKGGGGLIAQPQIPPTHSTTPPAADSKTPSLSQLPIPVTCH